MTLSPPLILDCGLFFLIFLSIVIGALRGATREILSISGWAGAFAVVFYGLPVCRPFGRQYIDNPLLADVATGGGLFICSLIIFLMISRTLSSFIKAGMLSSIDRALGLVFGGLRGLFLVCCLYLALIFIYSEDGMPDFIKNSKLCPWIALGAEEMKNMIPQDYLPHHQMRGGIENLIPNPLPSMEDTVRNLSTLQPTPPEAKEKTVDIEGLIGE